MSHNNVISRLTEIASKATFGKCVEILVTGNDCSVFLLFSRLKMDHLNFVLLLLIVSVTTMTFGSMINAKNPSGEVKKE